MRSGQRKDGEADFNPRSYKRSDGMMRYRRKIVLLFQSTLLQEERQQIIPQQAGLCDFNPRSYKRSDLGYPPFFN